MPKKIFRTSVGVEVRDLTAQEIIDFATQGDTGALQDHYNSKITSVKTALVNATALISAAGTLAELKAALQAYAAANNTALKLLENYVVKRYES